MNMKNWWKQMAGSKAMRMNLLAFLGGLALLALSGCAAPTAQGSIDPTQYNPRTGYPAVGSGQTWHM
jgi:hypothetical protein